MSAKLSTEEIKENLAVKTVRIMKRGGEKEAGFQPLMQPGPLFRQARMAARQENL